MCWTVYGSGGSSNRRREWTVAQMHEVLKSGGIDITERSLRTFLTKGVLPGRKVAEAARAMVSEEGKDPF